MPSFTFLIATLLLSCFTIRGHAETASHLIPINDLRSQCSFDLNGYVFDLCPLMGSAKVVQVPDESQDGRTPSSGRYLVLALGGFAKENDVVENSRCDEETWVCFITSTDEQPVIRSDKGSGLNLIIRGNLDHGPPQLQITFHGGTKPLDILLLCSEDDRLEQVHVGYDVLRFIWASRHGCPRYYTRRAESTLNTWTNGEQEPNGDEGEGGDELLPSDNRKARTGIAFVIAFIVLSVICVSTLASSTRARHIALELLRKASYAVIPILAKVGLTLRPLGQSLSSLTSKAMSSARFRPGDDDLLQWAQEEDMALNSDIMVNGSGSSSSGTAHRFDEENWYGSNEYIPLTTSPTRSGARGQIPSYGSTPEGSSLQGRAVMQMKKYFRI